MRMVMLHGEGGQDDVEAVLLDPIAQAQLSQADLARLEQLGLERNGSFGLVWKLAPWCRMVKPGLVPLCEDSRITPGKDYAAAIVNGHLREFKYQAWVIPPYGTGQWVRVAPSGFTAIFRQGWDAARQLNCLVDSIPRLQELRAI